VLAMKKDGLVLPGSRQEGRPAHASVRSAAVAMGVALAFTQAPRAGRACPSVWPAQLISDLVGGFPSAAIEEIVIDSRLDSGRVSTWALLAGVQSVAGVLNKMVAPAKAFDGNETRFGTSFVLYSGLISRATGNLSHRNLVVHDAMAHPADASAIRVVGRFCERWLSYALLPQHTPPSTRDDMLFLVVDEASVARFLQLLITGLCDSAPTSAHSILGRPVRGALENEIAVFTITRSRRVVSQKVRDSD